jgi:glutaminyl-tRNA synthetase
MSTNPPKPAHFLAERITADLAAGKNGGQVVTRFPPEPNGYLHIGHSKSICLNFGLAQAFHGRCHLRMDDTNPSAEEVEYVQSIERDVRWLGFDWAGGADGNTPNATYYASDFFQGMYDYAEELIRRGLAYVDSLSRDELRQLRGSFDEPGRESPHRNRGVAENLDLFRRMKAGEFDEGSCVLRARIDMAHPNVLMRDPLLYRIKKAHHHRTGDAWCIYPMYDFAHPLEDAFEGITHSICTLEFESNRELYDWVLDAVPERWNPRPRQYEFARLALGYTVMSKRKLLQLVTGGDVDGWDDPRMPTIAGYARRGVRPEAIRAFADMIGVARNNSLVDIGKLEHCIRADLEPITPRALCVLRPLKLVLTDWPADRAEMLRAPWFPDDPSQGARELPFGRELFIDREDFALEPPPGWHRLAPAHEVRLRHGYVVRCIDVVRDGEGDVTEVHCTHDPQSKGGATADGRKVKGTLHWVSAAHAVPVKVRLYDRLFTVEQPDASDDYRHHLNPESLVEVNAVAEPALGKVDVGTRWQFERLGWFYADPVVGRPDALVFNRVIPLRDSWAKATGAVDAAASRPVRTRVPEVNSERRSEKAAGKTRTDLRAERRAEVPELAKDYERFQRDWGLPEEHADLLTADVELARYFAETVAAGAPAKAAANWAVNELLRAVKERPLAELPLAPTVFSALVVKVDGGELGASAGKQALAHLCTSGGTLDAALRTLGLERPQDGAALDSALDAVIADKAVEVSRYRAGEAKLLGVILGAAMQRTKGAFDGKAVKERLVGKLTG